MAKYIRNPGGHVHSISDEAYAEMLQGDGETDKQYLPHGYKELSEADAKKANPQLFGAPDPDVEAAKVRPIDPNKGTSAEDLEARVNALVEERVREALAAALAEQPDKK